MMTAHGGGGAMNLFEFIRWANMRLGRTLLMGVSLVLLEGTVIAPVSVSAEPLPPPKDIPGGCECVAYVRTAWNVSDPLPSPGYAYFMGENNWFENQGFQRLYQPQEWAAVVFPPGWGGAFDSDAGHVALIKSWSRVKQSSKTGWKVVIRGANQSYSNYGTWRDGYWAEQGCTNVTDTSVASVIWDDDLKKDMKDGGVHIYTRQ
jgi:hypothetical protein